MQMRCRECAAGVDATAWVCSRWGAPIVGQQPPVVTDTVVGAVTDAAGKAVSARVADQPPPAPFGPGSGDRIPAGFRLVRGGYVGVACGLFTVALACAAAVPILFTLIPEFSVLAVGGCIWGLQRAFKALKACIRFSRLLRRPSDLRTATVTASKRDGRILILDIPRDCTGREYQSLSEVRLALRTKASMLMPGDMVNVYGGSGGKSELLISSPPWGRAFLGAVKSQSALQPRLLDEKVSGVVLVDWAAWAASTTFSFTGLGYKRAEVDGFRSAVRDTFLGVGEPAVRSEDLRGKQFSTPHLLGYDKREVEAFVEVAGLRLAAMESTDRPAGALVSGALFPRGAGWVREKGFSTCPG